MTVMGVVGAEWLQDAKTTQKNEMKERAEKKRFNELSAQDKAAEMNKEAMLSQDKHKTAAAGLGMNDNKEDSKSSVLWGLSVCVWVWWEGPTWR